MEDQYRTSTRKLVDSVEEQHVLEDLLEAAKPARPKEPEFRDLHYLLYTPFRYAPLDRGSRFGSRFHRGIWYGSENVRTCLAERAYYGFLFVAGTTADLKTVERPLSAFSIAIDAERAVDLASLPFTEHRAALTDPTSYAQTQPLGEAMRADQVQAFRFLSCRDQRGDGMNIGVLCPRAFAKKIPEEPYQSWRMLITAETVEFYPTPRADPYVFTRDGFLINGELPAPALKAG